MEFIGDSLTSGYGNMGVSNEFESDCTKTWFVELARHFNCDFVNNTAVLYGGGVNYRKTPYNITFNGNFINNTAKYGGGVNFFESFKNVVFNCEFDGNSALYGGAMAFKKGTVKNVLFK